MGTEKKIVPKLSVYAPEDLAKKWFVWYKDDVTGKRIKVYRDINCIDNYLDRLRYAEKVKTEIERELRGLPTTLENQIRELLAADIGHKRPKTLQSYSSCFVDFFAHVRPGKLDNTAFRLYFHDLLSRRSPRTHNKTLTALRVYLKRLRREYLLDDISAVPTNSQPDRYFQSYQRKRLQAWLAENDPELLDFCRFVYYTFARPGELRKMLLSDILQDDWMLLFRGEISKNKKLQYVKIPVPFRNDVERILTESSGRFIFSNRKGEMYGSGTMYRRHVRALAACGLNNQGYTLYSWKHTGAVAAAKSNIPIKQLQLQLRHHSLDQVDQYLRQMGVSDLREIAADFPPMDA